MAPSQFVADERGGRILRRPSVCENRVDFAIARIRRRIEMFNLEGPDEQAEAAGECDTEESKFMLIPRGPWDQHDRVDRDDGEGNLQALNPSCCCNDRERQWNQYEVLGNRTRQR